MKIEKTAHANWTQAYRCTLDDVELVAIADVGPRILSLRVGGGENLLFEDREDAIGREAWRIRGGHRFWVSPENENCYAPDNEPCEVTQEGEALTLTAAKDDSSGLRRALTIRPAGAKGTFEIVHRLTNHSPMLAPGGVWALTCAAPRGRMLVPWEDPDRGWSTPLVRYWRRWAGGAGTTQIESKQWRPMQDVFVVEPTGETGKVGLESRSGLVALLREDATFVKAARRIPEATYPDGGCNVEMYTCQHFLEMETLSPAAMLAEGEALEHVERWTATTKTFEPGDWREIEGLIGW